MPKSNRLEFGEIIFIVCIFVLVSLSLFVLRSIASYLFPNYFIYIAFSLLIFLIFLKIDFQLILTFSPFLYILSIILLILPLVIGQITRGAIRWIPLGNLTLQPSEIVKPFLILFFSKFISEKDPNFSNLLKVSFLFFIPFFLILIQPSLGVSLLLAVGFAGVLLASNINKKIILISFLFFISTLPIIWSLLLPYQKERLIFFMKPFSDPQGAGYNSIQSMIAVGSGKFWGRGLGEGVQTQLAFLPERHTDFIFASISEELGFIGSFLVLLAFSVMFFVIINTFEKINNLASRCYISGIFLSYFVQTLIHIGMNLGLLPITGIPLPFVSAGGSALLGSAISLSIFINSKNKL